MATFISAVKYTQQGLSNLDRTTQRAAALKSAARKMGVKIKETFWTMGDQDGYLIFEAESDEAAAAMLLQLSALGNVHTSTCRAFTAAEMDKILAHVGGK